MADSNGSMSDHTTPDDDKQSAVAYRVIEEMIVTLKLPPGARLSEQSLSASLGIGRTPIREALQRLSFEGTVRIVPRSGAYVSEVDLIDQMAMIEVRRGIENVLAGRAARFATPEMRTRFRALAEVFARAVDDKTGAGFIAADREFNALLGQAARNTYAQTAIGPIQAQTRRFWYLHFQKFGDLKLVCTLHGAIARKVADEDEKGAREASDRLMDYVEEYTRKTLVFFGMG